MGHFSVSYRSAAIGFACMGAYGWYQYSRFQTHYAKAKTKVKTFLLQLVTVYAIGITSYAYISNRWGSRKEISMRE